MSSAVRPWRRFLALSFLALAMPARAPAQGYDPAAPAPITDPAAQEYRRLLFALNLNPIPWALVETEASALATQTPAEPGQRPLAEQVKAAVPAAATAQSAGTGAAPPSSESVSAARREAAAKVFVLATRAVARALLARLDQASSGDIAAARSAKALWGAFAEDVLATDARGAATVDAAWKALTREATSTAGATAGDAAGGEATGEAGGAATGAAARRAAAGTLSQYISASYLRPVVVPGGRLAPVPRASATFSALATIPRRLPPGSVIAKQVPRPRQVLHMVVQGADEHETALIALGDMAFDSPFIFGEPARSAGVSCNACHNKGTTNPNFFIPGLSARPGGLDVSNAFFAPHANDGHFDHVDTPDLRGIRFTAPYGRNGRIASLREFVRTVILHEFNGPEPDPLLLDGLVAYLNEFDFLPNPNLDAAGKLTDKASAAAHRGEVLFNKPSAGFGGGSCATCHVPSDFFLDRKRHDIGSAGTSVPNSLDQSFDTPTLLSCRFTPPYFHDGSVPTLAAVVAWFDDRFKLGLSATQRADLTAYVEAVGDGVQPFEDSPNYLAAEMEEFSFFLSTYEYLKDQAHWDLIDLTLRTVAGEIRFHAPMVQDRSQRPVLENLASLLDAAREAVKRGDVEKADAMIARYRTLYASKAAVLR